MTTPSRAAISWTTARMTIVIGKSHSSVRPVSAPNDAVGGDAAGIVAGDARDESRAHDREERDEAAPAPEAAAQAQELALLEAVAQAAQPTAGAAARVGAARTRGAARVGRRRPRRRQLRH